MEMQVNLNPNLFENYKIFLGLDNLYPVNWDKCSTEFINKPYDNYKNIIQLMIKMFYCFIPLKL